MEGVEKKEVRVVVVAVVLCLKLLGEHDSSCDGPPVYSLGALPMISPKVRRWVAKPTPPHKA